MSEKREEQAFIARYTLLDLNQLIFSLDEKPVVEYDAETAEDSVFAQFVAEYANTKPGIDWSDLEERAHFLSRLASFCEAQRMPIPFREKITEEEVKKLPNQA